MSLGFATNSALVGLRATSLGTRVVAENLANADVAGYGLRKIVASGTIASTSSRTLQTSTLVRDVDPRLLNDVRNANSRRESAQIRFTGLTALEKGFGIPGEAGAFNTLLTAFEASLQQAATTPDSTAALQSVAQTASRIVTKFNSVNDQIQGIRQDADTAIAKDTNRLNVLLKQVALLNQDIQKQSLLGNTPFGLMDERERTVFEISNLIPISEIPRENNRIVLVSAKGEILADLDHAEFSFVATPGIGPDDTRTSGALSAIFLNGRALQENDITIQTGALGANLELRDSITTNAQASLDLLAFDLAERFSGPIADRSLVTGELGLFTLEGSSTLPADAAGLARDMRLSSLIDPLTGDGLWRLRSGLNSPAPGPSLDPENISSMIAAIAKDQALAPGLQSMDMAGNLSEQVAQIGTARLDAEGEFAFANANHNAKQETLAERGVDTDTQMQNLISLERAYAANARVLSTIDGMIRTLLEI